MENLTDADPCLMGTEAGMLPQGWGELVAQCYEESFLRKGLIRRV